MILAVASPAPHPSMSPAARRTGAPVEDAARLEVPVSTGSSESDAMSMTAGVTTRRHEDRATDTPPAPEQNQGTDRTTPGSTSCPSSPVLPGTGLIERRIVC